MVALGHVMSAVPIFLGWFRLVAGESVRRERQDLWQYGDVHGPVRRVTMPLEWKTRRAEIVRGVQEVMGRLIMVHADCGRNFPDALREGAS